MGHNAMDAAEMIVFGLEENDKVEHAEILKDLSTPEKAVISITTDIGSEFFVEVFDQEGFSE